MSIKTQRYLLLYLAFIIAPIAILMFNESAQAGDDFTESSPPFAENNLEQEYLRWMLNMEDLELDGSGGKLEIQTVMFDSLYAENPITPITSVHITCTLHGDADIIGQELVLDGDGDYISCELPSIWGIGNFWGPLVEASNAYIDFNGTVTQPGTIFAHPDFNVSLADAEINFDLTSLGSWQMPFNNQPVFLQKPVRVGHFCYDSSGALYAAGNNCFIEMTQDSSYVSPPQPAPATFLMNLDPTTIYIGCSPQSGNWGGGCMANTFFGGSIPLTGDKFLDIDPLAHGPGGNI